MIGFIRKNYLYLIIIFASILFSLSTLMTQSILLDEAQSLWVSTKSVQTILYFDAQDVLVPLYELLLHFWIQIFGNTIIAARSLSFLFFLATLPFLYQLGKEASDKKTAMITVTLFALSPFILWYSSEARMYSLFAFIATINHIFFLRYMRSSGKHSKFGYIVSTIVGLYTHYFFIFLLFTQFIFLLLRWWIKKVKENLHLLFMHMLMLFVSGLFFLPWAYYFISLGAAANTQPLIPPPTSYNLIQSVVNFLFGFQSNAIQSILISLWPIFILGLFIIFTKNERQNVASINYFAFATFFPIIIIFLGSFIKPIFLSRYLILVTPTLFFLLAWTISRNRNRIAKVVLGTLFIAMFVSLVYQNISITTPVKKNYKGVASYLEQQATPSDIIAVSAPFTVYPIEYSYQGNTKIVTIPLWNRFAQGAIPPFTQAKLVSQITSYQKQYIHIFVVLSYNQGYNTDIQQYMDTHYKRVANIIFSPGLTVSEYQLRYLGNNK